MKHKCWACWSCCLHTWDFIYLYLKYLYYFSGQFGYQELWSFLRAWALTLQICKWSHWCAPTAQPPHAVGELLLPLLQSCLPVWCKNASQVLMSLNFHELLNLLCKVSISFTFCIGIFMHVCGCSRKFCCLPMFSIHLLIDFQLKCPHIHEKRSLLVLPPWKAKITALEKKSKMFKMARSTELTLKKYKARSFLLWKKTTFHLEMLFISFNYIVNWNCSIFMSQSVLLWFFSSDKTTISQIWFWTFHSFSVHHQNG